MKRFLAPACVTLACAIGGYFAALALTPYVLMDRAIDRIAQRGPMNSFTHAPPVNAAAQAIVRPSPDLLYSSCPFDLSAGPLLVTAVPVPGRYSSISIFDARTDVAFVRNDEQMAGRPMQVVLAMAGQRTPPAELATVDPIRRRATCSTLNMTSAT
ncbi:MAG: DUF1254 domain-containing protein [Sphingopyxis sp.]|nr:DUF1254 domain-containing protein [Sphingopyxis sp.]